VTDRYASYSRLNITRPAPRVLKIELNRPEKLNATDDRMHHELVAIWRDVDADPEVSASILTGAGKAFSAGGDFQLIHDNINDPQKRAANWKGARDLVYNVINSSKPIVSAIRGPAVGAGLTAALLADISIAEEGAHHRRTYAARRCRGRPRGDPVAVAVRNGQGEILPSAVRCDLGRGGGTDRARLARRGG
jgi:enoyl-CoA hydratase